MSDKEAVYTEEEIAKLEGLAKWFGYGAWICCVIVLISALLGASMDKPDVAANIMRVGGAGVIIFTLLAYRNNNKALSARNNSSKN